MKTCTRCKEDKSTAQFTKNKNSKDGLSSWCKQCKSLSDKRYVHLPGGGKHDVAEKITEEMFKHNPRIYAEPKPKLQSVPKKRGRKPIRNKMTSVERAEYWSVEQKKRTHKRRVHKYGITVEQHLEQLVFQDYKCGGCKEPIDISSPIDHCHSSLRVRGILCRKCNLGVGFFDDDPEKLIGIIRYLYENTDVRNKSIVDAIVRYAK